jgi:ABC-type multidrug transport system fused ATPase/permease subunit
MGFTLIEGLQAEAYDRTYTDRQLIRRIARYFKAQFWPLCGVIAAIIIASCLDASVPFLISQGIDLWNHRDVLPLLALLVGCILAAAVLSWIAHLIRETLTARVVGDVSVRVRKDAFQAVMERDLSFFDAFSSGSIVSRVTADTDNFTAVITLSLEFLSQALLFVLVAGILFFRNWQMALLTLAVMPAIIAVSLGFRYLVRHLSRYAQRSLGRMNTDIQEILRGITVTKNFRQERRMYQEFQHFNQQAYHINVRADFFYKAILPVLTFISNGGLALVVYVGGRGVINHSITPGDWFLFMQCLGLLWIPLTSIASFGSQYQQGIAASERVFALLDAEPQVHQKGQQHVEELAGKIEFAHVFFRYDQRQNVLTDFNLTIQPGETVALVGHTGAGKSSLGKLIARFYEFQGGQILIDDHDIRSFDLHSYHRHLGIIPQVPYLFTGTVADNIRYAQPQATREAIEEIVAQIGGGDWLKALPDGLDTLVGEGGKSLSMGQRQLIACARALLQRAEIVIMDEATASIDPLTEAQLQECLDVMLKQKTAIVIAHRLSTIKAADRILVLKQGTIVEEGDHRTLLQQAGEYARLYNTYFRHQTADYQPGKGFVPICITST